MKKHLILLCLCSVNYVFAGDKTPRKFPEGFLFGASTAAYQIEGAWNASDKGESIWDSYIHNHPDAVYDTSNGDVACDSYRLYKRDVEIAEELGLDFYRFSIAWPRLLPNGLANYISEDGTRYYNDLINELLNHNISPVVTLYHWDLPQSLQELGGWVNPIVADYFVDYSRVAYELFGDRVKIWQTFNEPKVFCQHGYGSDGKAPALNQSGIGDYLCGHTVLLAHAKAYHVYVNEYKEKQGGRIGITLSSSYFAPASDSDEDKRAANAFQEFELGWFAHPIFSERGDYPDTMKNNIAIRSSRQGYNKSRLPEFSQSEIDLIRGSSDFMGLNHYTTHLTTHSNTSSDIPDYEDDSGTETTQHPSWPKTVAVWLKVVPWGFKELLKWISNEYNNPEVIVFENGYPDVGEINDVKRVSYLREYLNSLWEAMEEGCNVTGYSVWSLIDNFEWLRGYTERFGLYYVHYDTPDKIREPKASAKYFKEVVRARSVV